jgi:hypothetical protein
VEEVEAQMRVHEESVLGDVPGAGARHRKHQAFLEGAWPKQQQPDRRRRNFWARSRRDAVWLLARAGSLALTVLIIKNSWRTSSLLSADGG